jgi:hypothetical protein
MNLQILNKQIRDVLQIKGFDLKFESCPLSDDAWHPDFIARASFKNIKFNIAGEFLKQKSLPYIKDKLSNLKLFVGNNSSYIPVIISEYFSPDKRELCRGAGVYYMDLSGNVFLEHNSIYIERVGFPNRYPEKRKRRSPFSDKASLILRAMLADIDRLWGVRELAQAVKLDPGFVSRMAKELENRGYVIRLNAKIKPSNPKDIIHDWVNEYDYRKNREFKYFCMADSPGEIIGKIRGAEISDKIKYAMGFHAGAGLVAPHSVYNEVHIYIQKEKDIEFFVNKFDLREVARGANIIFCLPHYKHSVFYDMQESNSLHVVSDIQLYLDLCKYPIRGIEQAEHLYKKRLNNILEKI